MKKLLIILSFIVTFSAVRAYDWVPKNNSDLRADMLTFAKEFSRQTEGTEIGTALSKWIDKTERQAEKDEYGWMLSTYRMVQRLEAMETPKIIYDIKSWDVHDSIRVKTLQLLDYPIHFDDDTAKIIPQKGLDAFRKFKAIYTRDAQVKFLKWLDTPLPEEGSIDFFKEYNLGFVFRTSKHIVAFDLCWGGTRKEAEKIASKIDILFLSHAHGDHFSKVMLESAAKMNVPMILPEDVAPFYNSENKIILTEDLYEEKEIAGIKIRSLRGYQYPTPCNIYTVDIDGWKLATNGDNNAIEKERETSRFAPIDIVFTPAWNSVPNILTAIMNADGQKDHKLLYIPGHENELGHSVDHRESFHETYTRKDRLGDPDIKYPAHLPMNIGEHYKLTRDWYNRK